MSDPTRLSEDDDLASELLGSARTDAPSKHARDRAAVALGLALGGAAAATAVATNAAAAATVTGAAAGVGSAVAGAGTAAGGGAGAGGAATLGAAGATVAGASGGIGAAAGVGVLTKVVALGAVAVAVAVSGGYAAQGGSAGPDGSASSSAGTPSSGDVGGNRRGAQGAERGDTVGRASASAPLATVHDDPARASDGRSADLPSARTGDGRRALDPAASDPAVHPRVADRGATTAAPSVKNADARGSSAPAATEPSPLARETSMIDDARKALAGGDASGALVLLDRHDRAFPAGALATEASVLRVDALVAKGDKPAAKKLAAELLARDPSGAHARHLRTIAEP